jgi:hypothetical protein
LIYVAPPGRNAQLNDPCHAGQRDEQHAEHRGQQQRHPERQVAVCAEVADVHGVAVLQDEDQQE